MGAKHLYYTMFYKMLDGIESFIERYWGTKSVKENNKALNGLKGLCCIPIVFYHYYGAANWISKSEAYELPFAVLGLKYLYEYGYIFTYLFFWISGYCIAAKYKYALRGMRLSKFLKHRLRNLYPMVFMSILIGIMVSFIDMLLTDNQCVLRPLNPGRIILSFSLMYSGWCSDKGPLPYGSGVWFICVLLLCYIIYWIIKNHISDNKYILSLTIMFFIGWTSYNGYLPYPFLGLFRNGEGYCGFFGGAILYELLYGELNDVFRTKISEKTKNMISIIVLGVIVLGLALGKLSPIIMLLVLSPIVLYYALRVAWAKFFLELGICQLLGTFSMSIYLSHVNVISLESIIITYLGKSELYNNDWFWGMTMFNIAMISVIWFYLVQKKFTMLFISTYNKVFVDPIS